MLEPSSPVFLLHYLRASSPRSKLVRTSADGPVGAGLQTGGGLQVTNPRALPSLTRSRLQLHVGSRWMDFFSLKICFFYFIYLSSLTACALRGLSGRTRGFASAPTPTKRQTKTTTKRRCSRNLHAWRNFLFGARRRQQAPSMMRRREWRRRSKARTEVSSPLLLLAFIYSTDTRAWMSFRVQLICSFTRVFIHLEEQLQDLQTL